MDIFDVLGLIGGLCLFLFGMNVMGESLERRAGSSLRNLLGKLTTNRFTGFLTGLLVTAVIQSSSATTVMLVGFVNSGIMKLAQAIPVIMGANIGTTITAWIITLANVEASDNWFLWLFDTDTLAPIALFLGIVLIMFIKTKKAKTFQNDRITFTEEQVKKEAARCLGCGATVVDENRCIGCGLCKNICPKKIISMVPRTASVAVLCNSKDKGADARRACTNACIGCKKCELNCPEKAIAIVNNVAVIDYDKCTGCKTCIEGCPTHAIKLI